MYFRVNKTFSTLTLCPSCCGSHLLYISVPAHSVAAVRRKALKFNSNETISSPTISTDDSTGSASAAKTKI